MSRPSSRPPFPPVPSGYPFPRLELEVLAGWKAEGTFARTLERPAPKGDFVFYEGPPTANNVPHVGHVVTRVVKDLYPRFRTMRGYRVPRKAGWDTHGLPVEIEVEKRLGFTGKREIEEFGIAEFNAQCLESVHQYERQWRAMTERVAYWTDLDDAYFTYTNEYVESVWWALKRLWDDGLLEQGYKIQPYCARCGTTLSSHEVAQNYKETDDPSVWVRFPVRPGQRVRTVEGGEWESEAGVALVAWTTTPWTLLSHAGLTVNPKLEYRLIEDPLQQGGRLVIAEGLEVPVPAVVEGEGGKRQEVDLRERPALARFRGEDLVGVRYERPFRTATSDEAAGAAEAAPPSDENGWLVVAGDYVTLTDGTGIVHTAPLYGEDDYKTGQKYGLPEIQAVDREGKVRDLPGLAPFAGLWFKEADPKIARDLKERGLLLHQAQYRHNYPFCWRCDRPLLYYANLSWFVRTTKKKDELVAKNRQVAWHPAHVGEGRFGNWLENVVDWALSRKRYWGTPLPVWECDRCPHKEAVGSYRELFVRAGRELPADPYDRAQFDPHRPFVDRAPWKGAPEGWQPFTWPCRECGEGTMGRVDDVIDAWFDSGAMPFAQHHYLGEPLPQLDPAAGRGFPADLISEAVDQTRGWFYTLHVLGTLLFDSPAYRNVIVLGHVNDEQGRKMSKRLGNVVEPMAVMEETGADALRWYFCVNNPETSARFSARLVREAAQKFLLPLWNALSFFTIYANLDGWHPPDGDGSGADDTQPPFAERPALDRWVLLRLDRLVRETTGHLDGYRTSDAARGIEIFLEELTNWYIRRSRERFWAGPTDDAPEGGAGGAGGGAAAGKESAYRALYEVLTTLARLIAPFTPFVAETLHGHLVKSQRPGAADSVHLEDWPEPGDRERREPELEQGMAAVQRIVALGHAARNLHGLKTRQPLARVTLVSADPQLAGRLAGGSFQDLVEEELNVKEVSWARDRTAFVRHEVKPVYPKLGPRFGKRMKEVAAALAAADGDAVASELEERGSYRLRLADESFDLTLDELEVRLVERAGTATQGDRELLVALDTELTPELVAEGLAREVVHLLQTARKELDLDYADRIRVRYSAAPELTAAVAGYRDWIAEQTLATELAEAEPASADAREATVEGHGFRFSVERAA